ncbi:MAG: hypothetical protein Kow0077_20370 [Anaerolineae bacterium]
MSFSQYLPPPDRRTLLVQIGTWLTLGAVLLLMAVGLGLFICLTVDICAQFLQALVPAF